MKIKQFFKGKSPTLNIYKILLIADVTLALYSKNELSLSQLFCVCNLLQQEYQSLNRTLSEFGKLELRYQGVFNDWKSTLLRITGFLIIGGLYALKSLVTYFSRKYVSKAQIVGWHFSPFQSNVTFLYPLENARKPIVF